MIPRRYSIVLAILMVAAFAVAVARTFGSEMQAAGPMKDYDYWRRYEYTRMDQPLLVQIGEAAGQFKFFGRVHDAGDSPQWWVFYVDPGAYPFGYEIVLKTTHGMYTADEVVFTTWYQKEVYSSFSNFPVTVNASDFESEKVAGKRRVVAFAHFPEEPQGDLVQFTGRSQ